VLSGMSVRDSESETGRGGPGGGGWERERIPVEDERAALVERPLQDVREHERALCDAFVDEVVLRPFLQHDPQRVAVRLEVVEVLHVEVHVDSYRARSRRVYGHWC